jgi:hypothetical protein
MAECSTGIVGDSKKIYHSFILFSEFNNKDKILDDGSGSGWVRHYVVWKEEREKDVEGEYNRNQKERRERERERR